MRILFHKLSDTRHALEIVRDGRSERVECETRSYLLHDLLHYAVESRARLEEGFWGNLAAGKTLEQLNERTGDPTAMATPEIAVVERVVGALSPAVKGRTSAEMMAGLSSYASSAGWTLPAWLTEAFIADVQETIRRLQGRWRATAYGGSMELAWPASHLKT